VINRVFGLGARFRGYLDLNLRIYYFY